MIRSKTAQERLSMLKNRAIRASLEVEVFMGTLPRRG